MIFVYSRWVSFCKKLAEKGMYSLPANQIVSSNKHYIVLKHDVETNVSHAYKMALIEHKYKHCGSYYIQAYLMKDKKNIHLLTKMKNMGHEISYHYDVMDSNKGDIDKAIIEFENNKELFHSKGFTLHTVCQHGNPVIDRIGYSSNRDFFRNKKVRLLYPEITDIMVNFHESIPTKYVYYSDAGIKFNQIYDPINNDIIKSNDKNISYKNLNSLLNHLPTDKGAIISTHPHRWSSSVILYVLRITIFNLMKFLAKFMIKIPFFKKIINKYYYLSKKI